MITRVCALRSGSSGNSIFLESGKTSVLVDAGINGRTVEKALSDLCFDPKAINGILITHEHRDHIAGVGVLSRRYKIPIYVNLQTYMAMHDQIGKIDPELINIIEPDKNCEIGDISFRCFATSHDCDNPVGYRISTSAGDVAICTDTGRVSEEMLIAASGSRVIFIEANYDEDMLLTGPYPYFLKKRISGEKGHLSNDDSARAIISLAETGSEQFVLSHLSQDNNMPYLALQTIRNLMSEYNNSLLDTVGLSVAKRYMTSVPIIFDR